MEESELHEVLHHTLANVDGKAYRTMMAQIFSQRISPAIDYTYDSNMLKVGLSSASKRELSLVHRRGKCQIFCDIFLAPLSVYLGDEVL